MGIPIVVFHHGWSLLFLPQCPGCCSDFSEAESSKGVNLLTVHFGKDVLLTIYLLGKTWFLYHLVETILVPTNKHELFTHGGESNP